MTLGDMMGKGCECVFAISSTQSVSVAPVHSIPPRVEEREMARDDSAALSPSKVIE